MSTGDQLGLKTNNNKDQDMDGANGSKNKQMNKQKMELVGVTRKKCKETVSPFLKSLHR